MALNAEERVKAVRAYALQHYDDNGWDILVECWENHEIAKATEGATTAEAAIGMMRKKLHRLDSIRRDIQGEVF